MRCIGGENLVKVVSSISSTPLIICDQRGLGMASMAGMASLLGLSSSYTPLSPTQLRLSPSPSLSFSALSLEGRRGREKGRLGGGRCRALVSPSSSSSPPSVQKSAEADVAGLLLRQRIVILGYQIDDFVADGIISQLLLLDAQDPSKDIRLFINSQGGSISAAMGIYDAIQLCRANVSTIAFGLAASTAAIILAGGSKGKRFSMPNARIMLHQPMGGASGQAIDVEIQAKEMMHHKTNIASILSQITRRPFAEVEKDLDRDRYLSPLEAMEYGLIDAVIDKESILTLPPPSPLREKIERRSVLRDAEQDPLKFLTPVIPDDEIY